MALLSGAFDLSDILLNRPPLALLGVSLLLTLSGCDTEKGTASQGAQAETAGSPAGSPAARYRIDRSQAGTALSSVQLRAPDGSSRPLTSLIGRPVLLNLWATWCAPCVEELPTLERLSQALGSDAHVVLLSQDLAEADVPTRFLTERAVRTPQNWHDPDNEVGLAAGGNLPTTILYDREGKEVLRVIGPLDWAGAEARALLTEAGLSASR
jgi:thiol-disulfide isomerase/thioredoxin